MKKLLIALLLFGCSSEEVLNRVLIKVSCTNGCDIQHSGEDGMVSGHVSAICSTSIGPSMETVITCATTTPYIYTILEVAPKSKIVVKAKDKDYDSFKEITVYVNGQAWATVSDFIDEVVLNTTLP